MAEHVFSAHMIEHEVIMAISAPLFVLARPYGVLLWSLPRTARVRLAVNLHRGTLLALWRWLTRPLNATLLHAVAIWVWHLPPLFEAAVSSMAVHRWQHLSFLATALVFWYSLAPARRAGQALWYVFFTMLHTSLLGALLALAPRVLYSLQTIHAAEWGLTPLEDQQLAGMLMWVPAGTVYAGAAWLYAARWIQGGARKGIATAAPARRDLGTP
jgi:putative membrane protein